MFLFEGSRLQKLLSDRTKLVETSLVNAIGVSVAHTALNLNVKAIVAATESGSGKRFQNIVHILILLRLPSEHVNLLLVWGAYPVIKRA